MHIDSGLTHRLRLMLIPNLQVLFLDQRGTGLSSTITAGTLARQGNAIRQAEYLKNFRADNVVRDCEAIRKRLMIDSPESEQKWSIIGQSFGGFCAVTYLSMLYVTFFDVRILRTCYRYRYRIED